MSSTSHLEFNAAELLSAEQGPSDARLVEAARKGDRDAFGGLVRRYERRLVRVICRFLPDFELSRDLAQETFLRAYERLDQFDPSRRFGPWLFRIGVNLTLDYLRKRKRRGKWSLFSESPAERAPEPEAPDPRNELDLRQEVNRVLDEIPEKYRSVLILRDLEGFSTSEIAAVLQRKEATIRWRLAEARSIFQRLWKRRHGSEGPGNGAGDEEPVEDGVTEPDGVTEDGVTEDGVTEDGVTENE